jgi:hypothetical protein
MEHYPSITHITGLALDKIFEQYMKFRVGNNSLNFSDEEVDEKGNPTLILTDAEKLELYRCKLLDTVKDELKKEHENAENQAAGQMET